MGCTGFYRDDPRNGAGLVMLKLEDDELAVEHAWRAQDDAELGADHVRRAANQHDAGARDRSGRDRRGHRTPTCCTWSIS